jgi:hypothetical protein
MRRRNGSAEPGSVKAAPPSDSVRNLGNGASRAHPAGARRKLPLSPANPRNAGVGEPCSREEIPAYPRSARKRQDRPVTPEVAGSSPVAPVKALQNCIFCSCVVYLDAESGPTTQTFSQQDPKRAKTARNRSPGCRFQADSGPIQTDRGNGVQLHETAGGQGSTSRRRRMPLAGDADLPLEAR